jgi:hypothetical protein
LPYKFLHPQTLEGTLFSGKFSARRLREFIPREGTELVKGQKDRMAKSQEEEQKMVEEEAREVDQQRKEEREASKGMEQAMNSWTDEKDQPGTGMEGEGNGYARVEGAAAKEGPGWEGNDGNELGDELEDEMQTDDGTATFFYEEGEHEMVEEEDIGIAG